MNLTPIQRIVLEALTTRMTLPQLVRATAINHAYVLMAMDNLIYSGHVRKIDFQCWEKVTV